ncbi:MAG TPA: hypothetical protein VF786_00205 [Terriglobales bacterium]
MDTFKVVNAVEGMVLGWSDMDSPFTLKRDAGHNVLLAAYHGIITDEVVLRANELSVRLVAQYLPKAAIADFSAVAKFDVTAPCVQRLALYEPELPGDAPIIMVAPAEHVFGMARMYEMLSSARKERVTVVHTLGEAYARLGLDDAQFEPVDLP